MFDESLGQSSKTDGFKARIEAKIQEGIEKKLKIFHN